MHINDQAFREQALRNQLAIAGALEGLLIGVLRVGADDYSLTELRKAAEETKKLMAASGHHP